MITYEANLQV